MTKKPHQSSPLVRKFCHNISHLFTFPSLLLLSHQYKGSKKLMPNFGPQQDSNQESKNKIDNNKSYGCTIVTCELSWNWCSTTFFSLWSQHCKGSKKNSHHNSFLLTTSHVTMLSLVLSVGCIAIFLTLLFSHYHSFCIIIPLALLFYTITLHVAAFLCHSSHVVSFTLLLSWCHSFCATIFFTFIFLPYHSFHIIVPLALFFLHHRSSYVSGTY
jgi:hypothetical protein